MLMIDRCCRVELLKCEPDLKTVLAMCTARSGETSQWSLKGRVISSKLLMSLVQRDHEVRMSLIEAGGLDVILTLLKEQDPNTNLIPFCMAMILSTFVLDDVFMETVQQRKECHKMFECCLSLLRDILHNLSEEKQEPDDSAGESIERDGMLSIRLCEACAQSIWGSSYFCATYDSNAVSVSEIRDLAELAKMSAHIVNVSQIHFITLLPKDFSLGGFEQDHTLSHRQSCDFLLGCRLCSKDRR